KREDSGSGKNSHVFPGHGVSRSEGFQLALHNLIALARPRLQSLLIDDPHFAAAVEDESGILQNFRSDAHFGAGCAEPVRDQFMSDREFISLNAIVQHQQPAAESLLERMNA